MCRQIASLVGGRNSAAWHKDPPEQQKAYPVRLSLVTGAWNSEKEKKISIQSFITPAMFIVSADVLPISRNTACRHSTVFRVTQSWSAIQACGHECSIVAGAQSRSGTQPSQAGQHMQRGTVTQCCRRTRLSTNAARALARKTAG